MIFLHIFSRKFPIKLFSIMIQFFLDMGKTTKSSTLKEIPVKKAASSKHRTSPRNAKGKDISSAKHYWIVKPEFGEAKWFGEEFYAQNYVDTLKGNPYEMKDFILFENALKEVNDHNMRLSIDNSKFLHQLKKDADSDTN